MAKEKDSGFKDQTNEERKEEKRLKELEGKTYRTFDDEPIKGYFGGSSDYEGDGHEQAEFFKDNSNNDELIQKISENEKHRTAFNGGEFEGEYVNGWCGGEFMHGQQWGGWNSMEKVHQDMTRIYDKYLDQSINYQGIVVSRLTSAELLLGAGNKTGSLDALKALYGSTVISKANMSCGVASKGLHIGDTSKNVELRIHIPADSKGAGMWIGDDRINFWGTGQREYMTNRDTMYIVGKTTTRTDHNGNKVYVVDMYYDGRMKHDYGK